MDYYGTKFEFDLQLFAEGAVTLPTGDKLTKKVYLVDEGWKETLEAADGVKAVFDGTGESPTLMVAVGASGSIAPVITGADAAAFNTLAVTTVGTFVTGTGAVGGYADDEAVSTVSVTFKGAEDAVLGTATVTLGTDAMTTTTLTLANSGAVLLATADLGAKVNNMSSVSGKTAKFQLNAAAANQTLVEGTVAVAAESAAKIGNGVYTVSNAGAGQFTVTLDKDDKPTVKIDSGAVTVSTAADATLTDTSIEGVAAGTTLSIAGDNSVTLGGGISLLEGNDTLTFTAAAGETITVTGDVTVGAGNDAVTIGGEGATTLSKGLILGDGANTVTISATGKVDITDGITGGVGVDTYVLLGVASAAEKITTITINNFGDGDKLTVGTAEVANPIPAESTKTYIVTAANNVTEQKGAVTIYMNYADLASAPAFDYQNWITKGAEAETEKRQIVFTSNGAEDGDAYVTLSRNDTAGIDVTVAEAAVGKFTTVNLGENTVTANITLESNDMTRLPSGVKANTVTFSIGGQSVQLTGTTTTVTYTKPAQETDPKVFTVLANGMITDATGKVTVNTVAYELGTAKMQITGAAANDPNTIVLDAGSTDIKVADKTYTLTADGATLSVVTAEEEIGGLTISEGSLTLKIPAASGNASAAEEAIKVGSTAYTLTRAAATNPPLRDLTVSSTGVVSKMDAGDTFTIGGDAYEVFAKALVKKNGANFTVFSTGEALAAASTYKEGTGLTVGAATAAGEAFKSYKKATLTDGLLALEAGGSNEGDVQFYGTNADVADLTPVAETTADDVMAAYNAAEYKVEKTASGFTISGGATTGTATKMSVAALGAAKISLGDGLNTGLVNFVTNDTAFSVSADDRAKMTITQTNPGSADTITGAVALTLALTAGKAQQLTLETVGATAKLGYVDDGTTAATIDNVAYHVLSNDAAKTLTVTKGEAADSVAVTAATEIQIGSTKYAVTTASTFVGGALETGSVTIAADKTGFTAINIPLEQNTDAMRITAGSFTNAESKTAYTSVEVVAKNGVATVLQGFGDVVGETITISDVSDTTGYTYRVATVDGANVIQRKVKDANDSTYITMKATPSGYASSITLADLTDVTQWGTDATAYTLGGTDKNELVLSDSAFGSWEAGTTTRVFNLQKDGVTVAVLRQTAAKTFTIERGAGTDAVNISIVAAKGDTGAIIRTKGFVSTDTVKANVAKISDQDVSLTLNGTQYDIPQNVGDVSVAVTEETAGNGSKLVTGSVKLTDTAGKNTVTVADGSIITIGGSTGSATITVTAAGVVSGLTATDTFSITNADGITTTYTVSADGVPTTGKTTLTATNGYDGKYVVTTANLGEITVTSTAGQSNVVTNTDGTGTVIAPVKNSNELEVALAEGKYVLVKVAKNGSTITGYAATATSDTVPTWTTRAKATDGGVIGYFQTVTDGTGKTTVTYVGDTIGMPVNLVATSIKTTANMEVKADAADIEALHIVDVAAGQTVTRNGVALTVTTDYDNLKKDVLGGTNTIMINATEANKYFKLVVVETKNGVTEYKIGDAETSVTATDDNYFTVTKNGTVYTIEYTEATTAAKAIQLTDASWANIKVDATNLANTATKLIINPAAGISGTGWADKYTVTGVKAGVAVQEADGAKTSGYIADVTWTDTYASITGYPDTNKITLSQYFTGAEAKDAVYFTVTSTVTNGVTAITLGDPVYTAPTSTADNAVSYLAFTRNGTVITADYVNNAGIPLTGLVQSDQSTPVKLAINASGLTLGTDATKKQVSEIVITDDTAASKNVDYNLTGVPGGVKVTGATDGKDTVAWTNTYDFDITLDIAKLIGDGTADISAKYFPISVKQAGTPLAEVEVNGVKTYEVGAAGDSSTSGKPHFKLVYTAATHTAVITYEQNSTSIDLAGTDIVAGSTVYVDAGGKAKTIIANIDFAKVNATNTGSPANFVVINLNKESDPATVVTKSGDKAADLTTNYLYQYTYAADKVVLGDLQPGGTKYFVVTTATGKDAHTDMATNQSLKGVTTYTVAAGVDTVPDATANYIIAKNVDGTITLSYHQSTTTASAIDLAEGGSQITVDASGLQDDSDVAKALVLAAEGTNVINYNVTGLPYELTTITGKQGTDATAYRETFSVTGQKIELANSELGKTVYYGVTGADDGQNRGKYIVTIGAQQTTRYDLAGLASTATENEIATALKGKNYFTVTTSAAGVVSITYTEAETGTAIKLSGAGSVEIDNNGAAADKITGVTFEKGANADYKLTEVRGATTITNNNEGSTYTVNDYVATYVIDGKIELSATGTGIVYYDLVRTESDTKIVTYKLGAAATTHTESNYFAVNYNAVDQGKVFVSYVNVGTDDYDLDDVNKVGLGKVGIDATSLPKGVTKIDISERGKSGDCEVRYEVTGVPATAEVVDATHTTTGDTVTKALDYAFKPFEKTDATTFIDVTIATTDNTPVSRFIKINAVKDAAGNTTGETYTFETTEPSTDAEKGGSVTITKSTDATTNLPIYTVAYNPKAGHDVVKLSGGQITLDASSVATGATINVTDTTNPANYAITNAPGGTTFKGLATDGSDTVKYSTKFAWDADTATANGVSGTYYAAMADNIVLRSGSDAVVPAAGTNYLAVTITAQTGTTAGTVAYAWMTPNEKTGVMEKPETAPTFTGRVTLTAPASGGSTEITNAWNFDASGFDGLGVDIVGVKDGSTISALGDDTTVTMTAASINDDMIVAGKKYMVGEVTRDANNNYTNAIKVNSDGVVSGIVKITKVADTSETLTAANKKSGATTAETVWVETAATETEGYAGVMVAFGANGIDYMAGLDVGEVVRVREKDGVEYTYTTTDGLLVTRTNASTGVKTYLGLDITGSAFFSGDAKYGDMPTADSYTTDFAWTANTSTTPYYIPVANGTSGTGIDGTATIDTNVTKTTKTATAGEYLLAVTMTESSGIFTMNVTPKVVDGTKKIVDPTDGAAFTGTVTLDMSASSAKPVILDVTGKTYVLDVDNAKAGSTFTGLGAIVDETAVPPVTYADTVDTADLAKGESVTVNGAVYTNASDTAKALAFANADPTNKDTKYWGLNAASGTQLLVTAASGTLTAINQGEKVQTVSYTAGTVSDGAVVTFNSTVVDAITSITGLTGEESVTVKNGDITTVYKANADGTEITRTITEADGTVNTRTITGVTAGEDILALTTKWTQAANTVTNTLDWTKDSIGYFKLTNNVAEVAEGKTEIASTDSGTYVAAQVSVNAETGVATLTLTGKTVTAGVVQAASTSDQLAAGDVVKVTLADGTLVSYDKNEDGTQNTLTTNSVGVQISGAKAGSTFANMKVDTDQVTTAALAAKDAISFNGKYVISAADNALTIAGNATDIGGSVYPPRIVAGSVQVGGKYDGSDEAVKTALGSALAVSTTVYGSDNVVSVVYTAGTKDTEAKDGVIATFTNGNPTSITGLTNGEEVVVTYKNNDTCTYTATNEAGTEITCVFVDGSGDTSKNWTRYCTTMTAGGNILDGTYANTTTTSIFNWSATKEATATSATGYFLISAADGTATVLDQTDPATSTVINAGDKNHYVDITATKDAAGVVTISKIGEVVVGIDGTISDVQDAGGEGILKRVTLQLPAGTGNVGTVVKANIPADRTEVPAFTATNVGNGSVIGGNLTAADQIVTATGFATGNTITVGDKTYIAGANNTSEENEQLKVYGDGKVEDGVLKLHTRAAYGLSEVTTYYVNSDMSRVSETIAYATSEKEISGAIVTIKNGDVKGLTQLGVNETVTITKTVTDKTGTATVTTTTYSVDENGLYTKTEDVNGVKTVSTGGYQSETDDMFAISWTSTSTTAKSQFNWANTGFFLLGENKYSGTVELAAQDTAVSINKSKVGNVYLEVTSTGNSAKGYEISQMRLATIKADGSFDYTTGATDVVVNVTAPSAGLAFTSRGANITLNVNGASAGKLYTGLAVGDTISFSGVANEGKMHINGTEFVSGAASNDVTLKVTDATSGSAKVSVGKGTLVVGAGETISSSVTNGATVAATGGDGVIATYGTDGHISSVTDLETGETATITEKLVETIWEKADDSTVEVTEAEAKAANETTPGTYVARVTTTTITKVYDTVTQNTKSKDVKKYDFKLTVTTKVSQTLDGANVTVANMKNVESCTATDAAQNETTRTETWYKEAVAATEDVLNLSGFTTKDAFAWDNSKTGYFAIAENAATVEKQTAAPTISTSETYLKVKTDGTAGATKLAQVVAIAYDATRNAWVETAFSGTVTIPATGDVNISEITNRGAGKYVFNVTGAATGEVFTGFTAKDTISTAATFYADNMITIGTTKLVAATEGQVVANGAGNAISGSFKIDDTISTSITMPKNAAGSTYKVAYTEGDGDATVIVKDGAIQKISHVAAGETVKITITDANGKVVTEEYAATAGSGADETKITKTVVDGVTTTTSTATLKASEKYSDIYGAAYTESSKTTVSQFAWTNVADGYFVPTFNSEKNTYTATIAPQASPLTIPGTAPATVYKAGDKFLKVTRTKATATENQTITAISLVELQSDGSFRDVTSNLGTGSTVAITLPSDTAITYAKAAGALYGVQLSVPATGSKITGLKAVDAIGTNAESKAEAGKAFGILSGTTLEATGMTITTATSATNVVVNGMNFVNAAANTAGLTIQANTASDTFLTKGTLTLNTSTTIIDPTKSTFGTNPDSAVMIQKLVKAVAPATEDTTGDKIIVTAADTDATGTVTVDIYGSFDATTLTSASAANLTITATNTSGTVLEQYAVDANGNITATNAAGSTKYYLATAPTGKIILDGTIDSTFDNAALVADAPYDSTLSGYKVTLLDNSRTTYYATQAGERLLSATYTKATAEGAKDTYAIVGLTGNNVKEIDTTALTSDKVTIDSTNLTAANIKLTDATGTTAVVQLASGTMTLEAGAISGVTALTLVSGELVNASGITTLTLGTDAVDSYGTSLGYKYIAKATVNGVTYKGARDAVVTAVKDGENYVSQLYSGSVTVATGDDALKLSGGSTVTATGSVTVEATAGAVSQISDFQKGEKVAIKTGTTTVTYEAISDKNIQVTTQPDGGAATVKMAAYTNSFFSPSTLTGANLFDAEPTDAGTIDWTSTTAKTTYRLVPAAGSTVDLSAASKQSSFSYADKDTHLYATTVTAGTNTLTVTVKEIVVDEKGALTADADAATTAANAGRFTLTTGSLKKGTTVTLNGASTVGQPYTYTTAKDSALTVEGDGAVVNGSLVLATTLTTTVDGIVTLNGAVASGTANAVTVTNGKVTAISGLDAGESVTIDNVKYEAKVTGTGDDAKYEIIKTVTKTDGSTQTATATVTKDTMANEFSLAGGLAFTTEAVSAATETAGQGQGQFQWATASTRGVGYFLIQKASATNPAASITVADQAQKTVFTSAESGNTYMVASLEDGVLTLTAQRATVIPNTETLENEVTFSDTTFYGTVKLNVAKDYTGALNYDAPSDRPYNVEFTNVTKGATLTNLGAGLNGLADKVTTVSLAENESVTVNDITYTAGAKGALTFQNGKLFAGTVKITEALPNSIVTTGNEKKGTASMTVGGAKFVGDDTNEVLVKVANGEITSITGLVNAGESITVTNNTTSAEYVYSVLDDDGTMIKLASDGVSLYTTIKNGGNVYVTKDTAWNTGVTFGPGGTMVVKDTTMTADSKVWSGKTVRYYRIGDSAALANGTPAELVTSATEGTQGEYYIAVSATDNKITSVTLMQVSATGELKKASTTLEKSYSGTLNIEAETALVYSAPATRSWHYSITGVTADAKITNLNEGDTVTTGDVTYQGTVTVDNVKYVSGDTATQTMEFAGGKPDAVKSSGVFAMSNGAKTLTTKMNDGTIYTVKYGGGKDELAVTVSNGEVTGITGLGTTAAAGTVTLEKVTAEGKETTTYTLKNNVITRTRANTAGTEITETATNTAAFDLIGGTYNDDAKLKDVAYNFTWTDAGTTGYFKVANLTKATTVKTAKGTIKTTDMASNYLAVKLKGATATSAEIDSIQIQRMTLADNAGMQEVDGLVYTGDITLTVPKGIALTFDRSGLGESMENAEFAVTGIAAGSVIKNLNAGETVTTGALAEDEVVTVNSNTLQAGAKNATLKVTSLDAANVLVTGGKVKLVAGNDNGYAEEITVAKDKSTNCIVGVTTGTIVVNATATGFTVEGLGVGEEFTVTEGSTTVAYKVSESTILRVKDGVTSVYKLSAATIAKGTASIASTVLAKESNWLTSMAYGSDAHVAVTARAKIDLKAADTALTKAEKAGTMMPDYYFVTDEAIDQKTAATKNGVIAATMVETTGKQSWELNIGAVTTDDDVTNDGIKDRTYTASDTVGQNIIAASGWSVTGGSGADTITGAASGSDTLVGGSGNDSMVGGGANDYFVHTGGKDTITKYTSGKDKVSFENGFDAVALSKSDVTLGSSESDMLILMGAAASQANGVTIKNGDNDEAVYYFGKSTAAANFTKLTDDAYYYGAAGQNNKITVSTDKTKATKTSLGATQTVNLADTAHYHNITEVNASGSANKVLLKANDAATTDTTTLRGGSYMTTLVGGQGHDTMFGGSGNDFFQFNEYSGTDVVSKYDGKKDMLYVAGGLGYWNIDDNKNLYLRASSSDSASIKVENVVGGTAVNIAADAEGNNVTSYFFGKSKAANTYTGTDDASKGATQHKDVFFVNELANSTTVKLFGVNDEIRIEVSKNYTLSDVMNMLDPKSNATNSIYNIENQKLTISDKSYSMSTSNTEVTMDGTTMTIKRTK